jgi:LysR family transcriptional regulator, transcriptional activator of nhaA
MSLNYHHLHCFWAIAEEGSLTRAAKRLHVTHSTLSVQLRALEDVLGAPLFDRKGRGLVLTPFGDEVRAYASEIFRIGRELVDMSRGGAGGRVVLRVGALATLPKTITCRLIESAFEADDIYVDVQHGPLDALLEDLAAGRLHVVLADQQPPQGSALRLYAHPLGDTELLIFGTDAVKRKLEGKFPRSLDGAAMLLPRSGTRLRRSIDAWLSSRDLHVRVVGEIDDAGTLRAFGLRGWGLFPVRAALASEIADVGGANRIGKLEGLVESYVAITRERTIRHPAIARLIERARARLD